MPFDVCKPPPIVEPVKSGVVHNSPGGETAKPRPPIFRDARHSYGVDSCGPQREAVRSGKITLHAFAQGSYPGERLPAGALPGLNSLGFWDAIGPQDWGLELHRNEGLEICLMETGGMPFVVEGQTVDLHPGDLTVTPPWQLHAHGHPRVGPGRLHWLILDVGVRRPNQEWQWPEWVVLSAADRGELSNRLCHLREPVRKSGDAVQATFRALAELQKSGKPEARISPLAVHVNALLWHLLELLRAQKSDTKSRTSAAQHTVELFLRDLEANPRSLAEDWTLENMAAECGLGVTAFVRYCRLQTNTSPLQHLNRLRLRHAAHLLRSEPARNITEIALTCGFNSSQYFSTQFGRYFKTTPRDYRKAG